MSYNHLCCVAPFTVVSLGGAAKHRFDRGRRFLNNGRPISNLLTVKNGDSLNVALLNHLKSYDFVLFVGVFPLQDLSCGFLGLFQALALPPFPMRGIYSAV